MDGGPVPAPASAYHRERLNDNEFERGSP